MFWKAKAKGFIYPDDFYLLLKAQQLRNKNFLVQPKSAPIHQKIKEAEKTLENEKLSDEGKHLKNSLIHNNNNSSSTLTLCN